MSDLRRLKLDTSDPARQEVLGSWQQDRPSAAARERAWAAISSGVGVGLGSTAAAAGSKAGKFAASSALKWIAGGALAAAALATGAAVRYAGSSHAAVAPTANVPSTPVPAPPPVEVPAPPPHDDETTPTQPSSTDRSIARSVPAGSARARPPAASASAVATSDDYSIREQLARIDEARGALRRGDTASALRALDAYDRLFPDGALTQEATVVRVQTLLAAGDRAGAGVVERGFLAAHPSSPYAARIRAMMTDSK
jgi:hypothetical protein